MLYTDTTNKITDRDIPAGANLDEAKLEHRYNVGYGQAGGADASAATQVIHRAYKAGTVLQAYVTPDAVPAGGTKDMTVDIKKSTGGAAWASILSATTTVDSGDTARTPIALSLSGTPTLAAGDLLQVVITVSGSGGTGVQGFRVDVVLTENGA